MTAVDGSGIRIMSDSLMPFQPPIDEPSNILPSLKNPSSTSRVGTVTCCSLPMVSVKRRSANLASFSLINLITSAGVTVFLQGVDSGLVRSGMQIPCHLPRRAKSITCAAVAAQKSDLAHHQGSGAIITHNNGARHRDYAFGPPA